MRIHRLEGDVSVLSDQVPVHGIGFLPVNAFVLHASEPVVIDTGMCLPGRAGSFMQRLSTVIDPGEVRWIWLTHPGRDHSGALFDLLAAAPQARLVSTFQCIGIMSAEFEMPLERVYLVNPGQSVDVGDRTLTAFRPPLFDSPAMIGLYDDHTETCFSSDLFGAAMFSQELAEAEDVAAVSRDDLLAGQLLWAVINSPWVHEVDTRRYEQSIDPLRRMDPARILSTHLPPATGRTQEFVSMLTQAPRAKPFSAPDQAALERLLRTADRAVKA